MNAERDVIGIGNAIVDVLTQADDGFLTSHGLAKGSMTLIDTAQASSLYSAMGETLECSGGSAANSMVGIASLGGRAAYVGKVRQDALGETFARDIRESGVTFATKPSRDEPGTGRCLVLVTPDAQRTMGTFLGAAATLAPSDIDEASIAEAAVTYLEGYLWDPPEAKAAFVKASELAHAHKRKVSLTLSDPFCVGRHRESFAELVDHHVDILFANEDEAKALTESASIEDAVAGLAGRCDLAVITRGANGSVVVQGNESHEFAAADVDRVVDTTGAGDLFAAGFLFGLTRNMEIGECARLGHLAAAEIISHFGARPEADLKAFVAERSR